MCEASVERLSHHTSIQLEAERFISSHLWLLVWWNGMKCLFSFGEHSVEVGKVNSHRNFCCSADGGSWSGFCVWTDLHCLIHRKSGLNKWDPFCSKVTQKNKLNDMISFQVSKDVNVLLLTLILSVLQFRALAPMYYRGSAAAIIVYDITKEVFFF